jgi:hypothetical protein
LKQRKTFVFSLLAMVALGCVLTLAYHSGYQRGHDQGIREEKLRSAIRYDKAQAAAMVPPRSVTLDNETASISVSRAKPIFKKSSQVNAPPDIPKP